MQQPIRSVWRSYPLLAALGAAVLVIAYYFSIPESRHDWAAVAAPSPEKTSPVEPPAALTANADEPATNVGAVVLPDFLQTCVNQVRKQGKNPWWADAIETAWTRGFPAAVEVLRASVPPEQLDEKVANLLSLIAQEKLEFLIEGLPMIHGATHPSTVASGPINHWARKDPMRMAGFALEHLDGEIKMSAVRGAVEELAKIGRFAEATSVLDKLPQSETRMRMVKTLAGEWGRQDFEGAIAWARALSSGADQLTVERSVINGGGFKMTLERARELAAQYATEQTRTLWDSVIGGKLLDADAEAAIALASTLSDESRRNLQRRIAPKLALSDLARGTAFALQIDDASSRTSAIDAIHRNLTQKSIQATINWTWTLPEEFQQRVIVGIVTHWYSTDEEATKSWVASLPASSVRDQAVAWLAWEVERTDPAAAANLANGITDPQRKKFALDELKRRARDRAPGER